MICVKEHCLGFGFYVTKPPGLLWSKTLGWKRLGVISNAKIEDFFFRTREDAEFTKMQLDTLGAQVVVMGVCDGPHYL
jgi:hypothetical protein